MRTGNEIVAYTSPSRAASSTSTTRCRWSGIGAYFGVIRAMYSPAVSVPSFSVSSAASLNASFVVSIRRALDRARLQLRDAPTALVRRHLQRLQQRLLLRRQRHRPD